MRLRKLLATHAGTDSLEGQDEKLPQALALHVKLSNRAFISGVPSNQVHLKIEVLFNGQLSSCRLVPPHDIRSGAQSLHQIFSGHRIDYLAERPYVILPPGMTADGGTRTVKNAMSIQERWKQISLALQGEADVRGADEHGNVPPTAEFLYALSNMQIPEQVQGFQTPGGRKFGVIDVIITAGTGRKITSGTSYLKAPQRLEDQHFAFAIHRDQPENATNVFESDDEKEEENLIDMDTRDDSDLDYAPDPKRSPLPSTTRATPTPKFVNPFSDTKIPSIIPLSQRDALLNSFSPTASKICSRPLAPDKTNTGYISTSSSPVRGRAKFYDLAGEGIQGNAWNSNEESYSAPQDTHSFMSQNSKSVPFCHMSPSPYSFLLSHGQNFPVNPMGLVSYGVTVTNSDPVRQAANNHDTANSQQFVHDPTMPFSSFPSTPEPNQYTIPTATMYKPNQALQEPFRFADAHPVGQVIYGEAPKSYAPFMASFSEPLVPYKYPTYPCPPPVIHNFSKSLPPAGLYSVPTKPGSLSKSHRKPLPVDLGLSNINEPQPSIVVNRLVVTGKHGITLIDQRWSVPQRVSVQRTDTRVLQPPEGFTSQIMVPLESRTQGERPCSRSISPLKLSRPISASTSTTAHESNASLSVGKWKRDSAHDEHIASIRSPSEIMTKTTPLVEEHLPTTKDAEVDVQGALMAIEVTANQAMHRRRTTTRSTAPSIQGLKAATYVLEDPEEVLREAKRLRRSRSPTKPSVVNSIQPQPRPLTPANNTIDVSEMCPSSPLSSVPPTPESGLKISSSPQRLSNPLSQLDGAPNLRNANVSPYIAQPSVETLPQKLNISSPPKPTVTLARRFQHQLLGMPQSSPSPSVKKRKFTKQPRSPDRLRTVDNPPLNRDCVIAFAEGKDKKSKKGALRQVKGERQGLFQEDYVVLATRFFVAGDVVEEGYGRKKGSSDTDL